MPTLSGSITMSSDTSFPALSGSIDMLSTTTTPSGTAPNITTTSLASGEENSSYVADIAYTGTAPVTLSISSGALPAGLALSGARISGTPTEAGSFAFVVSASNQYGTDTQALGITVAPDGAAPVITTTSVDSGRVGTAYSVELAASGTGTISWSTVSGTWQSGIALSADGTLSGTPTEAGTRTVTVAAANEYGSSTRAITLIVADNTSADTGWRRILRRSCIWQRIARQ